MNRSHNKMKVIVSEEQLSKLIKKVFNEQKTLSKPKDNWANFQNLQPQNNSLLNQIRTNTDSKPQQKLSQQQVQNIKTFVNNTAIRSIPKWPFKNNQEGDIFRGWLNKEYPRLAEFLQLEKVGKYPDSYMNKWISKAWNHEVQFGSLRKKLGDWFVLDKNAENDARPFYDRLNRILISVKKWWTDWLNNPKTKIKFKKTHNLWFDYQLNYWYEKYFDVINNVKIHVYFAPDGVGDDYKSLIGNTGNEFMPPGSYGGASASNMYQVNINLATEPRSDIDLFATIAHEIQHLLFFIKPLTSIKGITKFRYNDGCYEKVKDVYDSGTITDKEKFLLTQHKIDKNKINLISKDLGFNFKDTEKIIKYALNCNYSWKKNYFSTDNSEFLSRITGTRIILTNGIPRDLRKNDFINYMRDYVKNNKTQPQVCFITGYWSKKGFPPIEQFLNEINRDITKNEPRNNKLKKYDSLFAPKTGYA